MLVHRRDGTRNGLGRESAPQGANYVLSSQLFVLRTKRSRARVTSRRGELLEDVLIDGTGIFFHSRWLPETKVIAPRVISWSF